MPIWSPDVPHPLLIDSAADEELVVPPRSTAATERTFWYADVLRGLAVVLPYSDETFGEKKEQGCEDGLILSGEFPSLEDVVIVIPGGSQRVYYAHSRASRGRGVNIREVGLAPPSNSIRLAAEE